MIANTEACAQEDAGQIDLTVQTWPPGISDSTEHLAAHLTPREARELITELQQALALIEP